MTKAKEEFKCGNLFEVVCSQTFYEPCPAPPSELHRRIRERNPSPFSFLINLGDAEVSNPPALRQRALRESPA